jgi:hypothetical protein
VKAGTGDEATVKVAVVVVEMTEVEAAVAEPDVVQAAVAAAALGTAFGRQLLGTKSCLQSGER